MSKERAESAGGLAGKIYLAAYFVAMIVLRSLQSNTEIWLGLARVWIFVALTLFPPFWFYFESVFLYGEGHGKDSDYTHAQDLASKMWVACSVVAAIYWFHKL